MSFSFLSYAPVASVILIIILVFSTYSFLDKRAKPLLGLYPFYMIKKKEYYRLITSTFIHLNLLHFLLNVISFIAVGFRFEKIIGSGGFLIVYIGSLLISSGITTLQYRKKQSYNSIGASGPITGIILSWMWIRSDIVLQLTESISIPAWSLGFAFLVYSYFSSVYSNSSVNHRAHLWGGLSGVILTMILLNVSDA